jgi:hypothetical protein
VKEREHLHMIGARQKPAGTYAKQILTRLLIDLSCDSSRLEGNTYSLLDTKRLIELGQQAEGKNQLEAKMILNHKDAIEFLVSEGDARLQPLHDPHFAWDAGEQPAARSANRMRSSGWLPTYCHAARDVSFCCSKCTERSRKSGAGSRAA